MEPLDGVWHLLNFVAPAFGVSALSAAVVRWWWPNEFASYSWLRLTRDATAAGSVVLAAGLMVSGRDGRMSTYGLLVVAVALTLWWRGFGRRPR